MRNVDSKKSLIEFGENIWVYFIIIVIVVLTKIQLKRVKLK